MQNKKTKLDTLELAKAFEVEELEERVEFGRWGASEPKGGATCSGGDCSGKIEGVGVTWKPW